MPVDADVWFPEDDAVLPLLLPRWRKWAKEVRLPKEAGPDPGESRFFVGSLDLLTHALSGAACERPLSLARLQKIPLPLTLNPLFRSLATAGESELAATGLIGVGYDNDPWASKMSLLQKLPAQWAQRPRP